MRTFAAALVALALASAPAVAKPRGCAVLSDPAGDVTVSGTVPAAADSHVDVRTVSVDAGRTALTVRLSATDLVEQRQGEWRVTFAAPRARLYVGAGSGAWATVGGYEGAFGFRAGVVGRRTVEVRGTIDYAANEISVVVPYTAFGSAAPRSGDTLSGFAVEAREMFLNVAHAGVREQVRAIDTGSSAQRYVIGRGC